MELISKEFDIHVFLGSFNGSEIRFYADTQTHEIYINLNDLSLVTGSTPEHMTRNDYAKLRQSLINTLKTTIINF